MTRRKDLHKVVPFSRDYRRVRKFDMGLPPRKRASRWRRLRDPRAYLKGVMGVGIIGLIVLPVASDAGLTVTKLLSIGDQRCRVLRVVDGDTLTVLCNGTTDRARLMGFDTPELYSPSCASEASDALRATRALRWALWRAGEITMVTEGRDRYDRMLLRVFLDGVPLSRVMIEQGHARAYDGGARGGWC